MYVLRVGKIIAQGERAPKCTAINNNKVEPPGMNYAMRITKMNMPINCGIAIYS
jgi:hypothetical protein